MFADVSCEYRANATVVPSGDTASQPSPILGAGGEVSRIFCPVAMEMTNRLAQIGDVISLTMSDRPSGVHAIVFKRSAARVSATFRSPPPSGEITKMPSTARVKAIGRPAEHQHSARA